MTVHRLRQFISAYEALLKEYDDVISDMWSLSALPSPEDDDIEDAYEGGDIEKWLLNNYIDNLRLIETGKHLE